MVKGQSWLRVLSQPVHIHDVTRCNVIVDFDFAMYDSSALTLSCPGRDTVDVSVCLAFDLC